MEYGIMGFLKYLTADDIFGEKVNEMSYSDIKDVLGNKNKSDTD